MLGTVAPYLVAISAALFSGLMGLTLIYTVSHLDPPEPPPSAHKPAADYTKRA